MTDTPTQSVDDRGLNEINRSLGRIEGSVTAIALSITQIVANGIAQDTRIAEQGARIGRVENRINLYIGAAGALGAVLTVVGKYALDKLGVA